MPLALLVELLQSCEGVLRSEGLQCSGDQLHRLLVDFLARQQQRSLRQGEPLPQTTTQAPRQPRFKRSNSGPRRVPGTSRWGGIRPLDRGLGS